MNWPQLLSPARLGRAGSTAAELQRSPFQRDCDRLTFSSAFRRLQDKTQVFPLAESDYVRTRLTHSLEVSSVARSLGTIIGQTVCERHGLAGYHASDFGAICAAAALAHDLGNPPFGHSGEDAIRHWFTASPVAHAVRDRAHFTAPQTADFEHFEGNAQGFRLITRLQMPDNPGLRLTFATLGAFTKYPRASWLTEPPRSSGASTRKFGFFQAERDLFQEVAAATGLISRGGNAECWARHPLAFVVEAADDLCYRLVDFEDGFRLGHLPYEEVRDHFAEIADVTEPMWIRERKERVEFLRTRAIGRVVAQCAGMFLDRERELLAGDLDAPLTTQIDCARVLQAIRDRSAETIYNTPRGVEIEAAGFSVLGGLLDDFVAAVEDVAARGKEALPLSRKLVRLLPPQTLHIEAAHDAPYHRLLALTDFVSGMTDSYAVSLYRKVRGISLPH